jgi:hypothetical protein
LYLRTADKYGNDASYKHYHNLSIKYEMSLKASYGGALAKQTGIVEGMYYEKRLGKITSVADLNKRNSYRFLKDKAIEIVISLDIIEKNTENATRGSLNASQLSTSFETMYGNDKYSDYTLITSDGEEIPVHKNILASRSDVLAAMMETQLKEGEEKKAVIDDIDSKALKEFLRFLYCGRVSETEIESVAVDLIYAAEKYGLKDLKPICVQSMIKTISLDNAIETYILADLHQEKPLKKFTLDFILHHYTELKDHESWEKLSTTLYKEILDFAAANDRTAGSIKLTTTITIVQATPAPAVARQAAVIDRLVNAIQPRINVNAAAIQVPNANAQPAAAAPRAAVP